jgi:hypothetical protein
MLLVDVKGFEIHIDFLKCLSRFKNICARSVINVIFCVAIKKL